MVVKRFDVGRDSLEALLWVECKRRSGSVRDVELQALDACRRCIQQDNSPFIWAMTTVDLSFRFWYLYRGDLALAHAHGSNTRADRTQYIEASTRRAALFHQVIQAIKDHNGPQPVAPILPSQSLDLLETEADDTIPGHDMPADSEMGAWAGSGSGSGHGHQYDASVDYGGSEGEQFTETAMYASDSNMMGEASGSAAWDTTTAEASTSVAAGGVSEGEGYGGEYVESSTGNSAGIHPYVEAVHVKKIPHTFGHDEYVFQNANGHTKVTRKEQWKAGMFSGERVWFFHHKGASYISRKRIG